MKYFNLLFFSFVSFSSVVGAESLIKKFSKSTVATLKNGPSAIKLYGKNLTTDLRNITFDRSAMKRFAKLHPFLTAKAVQEAFGFMIIVVASTVMHCPKDKCAKTSLQHFKGHSRIYLWKSYIDFFKFIFNFEKNCLNTNNFFVDGTFEYPEGLWTFLSRFCMCPFLTLTTKLYVKARYKTVEKVKKEEKEKKIKKMKEQVEKAAREKVKQVKMILAANPGSKIIFRYKKF